VILKVDSLEVKVRKASSALDVVTFIIYLKNKSHISWEEEHSLDVQALSSRIHLHTIAPKIVQTIQD